MRGREPKVARAERSPLARKLQELRLKTGKTQKDAAKALGMAQSTLADYETGRTTPSLEAISRLSNHYGISQDELTKGEGFQPRRSDMFDVRRVTQRIEADLIQSRFFMSIFSNFSDVLKMPSFSLEHVELILEEAYTFYGLFLRYYRGSGDLDGSMETVVEMHRGMIEDQHRAGRNPLADFSRPFTGLKHEGPADTED